MARKKPAPEPDPESTYSSEVEAEEAVEAETSGTEKGTSTGDSDVESQASGRKNPSKGGLATIVQAGEVFLLSLAFVFFAFAAFSTPIIKRFYLFTIDASVDAKVDKVSGKAEFGVWGYCSTGITNTVGIGPFEHTSHATGSGCSKVKLGYTLADIPGFSNESKGISKALTGAFVLHIIAWIVIVFALICCLIGLVMPDLMVKKQAPGGKGKIEFDSENPSDESDEANDKSTYEEEEVNGKVSEYEAASGRRKLKGFAALMIFASLILALIVFLVDLIGLLDAKREVKKLSRGAAKLTLGNAFYFVLVATGIVLLAFVAAFINLTILTGQTAQIGRSTENEKESEDEEESEDENDAEAESDNENRGVPPQTGASSDSKYSEAEADMVDVDLDSDRPPRRQGRSR
ncbi:SUR7/PalI family-domain-containing protein [Phellopilus nigrolimitatus]|nr:SUR7/PalI family-domain-containing protein [Phellopilus nigrolimitatus]